jgi:hypothetical protein
MRTLNPRISISMFLSLQAQDMQGAGELCKTIKSIAR